MQRGGLAGKRESREPKPPASGGGPSGRSRVSLPAGKQPGRRWGWGAPLKRAIRQSPSGHLLCTSTEHGGLPAPAWTGLLSGGKLALLSCPTAQGGPLLSHLCNTGGRGWRWGPCGGCLLPGDPHETHDTPRSPSRGRGGAVVLFPSSLAPVYGRTERSSLWALGASRDGDRGHTLRAEGGNPTLGFNILEIPPVSWLDPGSLCAPPSSRRCSGAPV